MVEKIPSTRLVMATERTRPIEPANEAERLAPIPKKRTRAELRTKNAYVLKKGCRGLPWGVLGIFHLGMILSFSVAQGCRS